MFNLFYFNLSVFCENLTLRKFKLKHSYKEKFEFDKKNSYKWKILRKKTKKIQ